jgi:hypothetical protein
VDAAEGWMVEAIMKLPWYLKHVETDFKPPKIEGKVIDLYKYRKIDGLYITSINMTKIAKIYVFFKMLFSGRLKIKIKLRRNK